MKAVFFLVVIFSFNIFPQKKVCFTFDDFPHVFVHSYNQKFIKTSIQKFIDTLLVYRVPAIAFINEKKLYLHSGKEDPKIVELVRMWIDAGFAIGNHTYSHKNLNSYSVEEFKADVIHGRKVTNRILAENNTRMKYFRFPVLETGKTQEEFEEVNNFLKEIAYIIAPATMENQDYLYADEYSKAHKRKDFSQMERIAQDYLNLLPKYIDNYENQSHYLYQRQINHIMLFHVNELNVDYINEVCKIFIKKGYQFVTMEEAMSDPLYKVEEKFCGFNGVPFLENEAIKSGIFYDNEKVKKFRGKPIEIPQYLKKP